MEGVDGYRCINKPGLLSSLRKYQNISYMCPFICLQLFKVRVEAAKKFEEEHDRQLEEKKRRKEELRSQRGSPQKPPGGAHNKSGQWKESDSGLEWVMNPEEEKTNEDDSMNDSTEVSVPSSQEEEEDFTKGLWLLSHRSFLVPSSA